MNRALLIALATLIVACATPSAPPPPPEMPLLVIEEAPEPIDERCGNGCMRASQCAHSSKSDEERTIIAENCLLRCRPRHPQHELQARWTETTADCLRLASCNEYVACVRARHRP